MKNTIVINDPELDRGRLTSTVTVPKKIKKYFKSLEMFAIYDTDITAEKSILNIPMLATVLPLAWLTGSDIFVEELDRTFRTSIEEIKRECMKLYPKVPFTTKINTETLVEKLGDIIPTSTDMESTNDDERYLTCRVTDLTDELSRMATVLYGKHISLKRVLVKEEGGPRAEL